MARVVDPHDARARRVELTAKGRRRRAQFLAKVGDGSQVINSLPDQDRAELAALFAAPLVRSGLAD